MAPLLESVADQLPLSGAAPGAVPAVKGADGGAPTVRTILPPAVFTLAIEVGTTVELIVAEVPLLKIMVPVEKLSVRRVRSPLVTVKPPSTTTFPPVAVRVAFPFVELIMERRRSPEARVRERLAPVKVTLPCVE